MDIHLTSDFGVKRKFQMKRIAGFALLVALSVAWSIPAKAQRISVAEGERRSRKADKKQQKAMKKSAKAQRKAAKKANRRAR
jgi:hypothetical protein